MTYKGRNVVIEHIPFPDKIHKVVRGILSGAITHDDYYLILVDSRLHPLTQRHTLGHELAHLFMNHLDQDRPVMSQEAEANLYAWDYYRAYKSGELENTGNATATEKIRELNHRIWEKDMEDHSQYEELGS